MNTEDDFGDLAAMAAQATPSLEIFTLIGEGAGGDMVEGIWLHNPGNLAVSPPVELLDLAGFCVDGNYNWAMTINLPWFELRGLLGYPGL